MNGLSGLSPAAIRRLEQLEAKPELESFHRGELRAMAHSRPSPEERTRVSGLLARDAPAASPVSAAAPAPPAQASEVSAFERGMARGREAGGRAFRSS